MGLLQTRICSGSFFMSACNGIILFFDKEPENIANNFANNFF